LTILFNFLGGNFPSTCHSPSLLVAIYVVGFLENIIVDALGVGLFSLRLCIDISASQSAETIVGRYTAVTAGILHLAISI
jgi:hypothetical protein